jgi:hypothetical protein
MLARPRDLSTTKLRRVLDSSVMLTSILTPPSRDRGMSLESPLTLAPVADLDLGDAAADTPLLGASASSPVDVDTSLTTTTAKTGRTRAWASRFNMWQDMEEVKKVVTGKEIRCGAICNYCKTCLSAPSTGSTGHFIVILDHARGNLLLQHRLSNHICILILMAMFNIFNTIQILLGLSLLD